MSMSDFKILGVKTPLSFLSHRVQRAPNQHKINTRQTPLLQFFRPFIFIIPCRHPRSPPGIEALVKVRPSHNNAVPLELRLQIRGVYPSICLTSLRITIGAEFASFSSFTQSKCYLAIAGLWFSDCVLRCPRALA